MSLWPVDFINQIKKLDVDANAFINALDNDAATAIRLNPFKKNSHISFLQNSHQVPWCSLGYILNQRPQFTADPLFAAGAYYVQEISSMFLCHVVNYLKQTYDIKKALDLCAAPGGKTTILQSVLPKNSMIIANEIIKSRVSTLVQNIQKWGLANTIVTNNSSEDFLELIDFFDLVLVDAPCSGEGLFRKQPKAAEKWSLENVKLCSLRQQKILHHAINTLKPSGFLIYSTCTFNKTENEEIIHFLIKEYGFSKVTIPIEPNWQIVEIEEACYRFLPHLTVGEGLFMAIIQKPGNNFVPDKKKKNFFHKYNKKAPINVSDFIVNGDNFEIRNKNELLYAIPKNFSNDYDFIEKNLNMAYAGINLGQLNKNKKLIPHHALALYTGFKNPFQTIEVDLNEALLYLRKQQITFKSNLTNGFALLTYKNTPIGFVNIVGNRINNCYPNEWRIIKEYKADEIS
ncbi:MAG: methyltransferase RsmF C-terminal domain-like protein [Bacteroidia bacterium]